MKNLLKTPDELIEYLNIEKLNNDIYRLGKLFTTENGYYFYDTGTGKVIQFEKIIYDILIAFFKNDLYIFNKDILLNLEIKHFFDIAINEHLFQAPDVPMLYQREHYEDLPKQLEDNIQQIILEVTGKCNLRCKYCIYNDSYSENRDFNNENMTWETAKSAIDYLAIHGADEIVIGFYGGEPLLRYDLIKKCIEYSKSILTNKKITYSFTTNCTLLTEEMAQYFSTVDGISIMCSIDGPKDIHDEYRRDFYDEGSFDRAIKGLFTLVTAFEAEGSNSAKNISINSVFTPPFTYEKAKKIYQYFKELSWLPQDVNIQLETVRNGTIKEIQNDPNYKKLSENPIWNLGKSAYLNDSLPPEDKLKDRMFVTAIQSYLINIHKRFISDFPVQNYPFNGCCVPGARRLYINTFGELYLCERIENSPSIGNIQKGIDIQEVFNKYVTEYSNNSIEQCKKCWAIRLCRVCYAECYNNNGIDKDEKLSVCYATRKSIESSLKLYHEIMEKCPDKLDELNHIVTV